MVIQLKNGNVINRFNNAAEAGRRTGIFKSNIYDVLKGKRKTAGGFEWEEDNTSEEQQKSVSDTTFSQDLENGTLKIDTYYDNPPQPEEVIAQHRIDLTKWKLSSFYSKAKAKGWLVTALFSNIQGREEYKALDEEALERVIEKYVQKVKYIPGGNKHATKALRVIITDAHIGMEITNSMFGRVWNKTELNKRCQEIITTAIAKAKEQGDIDRIDIVDLGDFLDGQDGQTVRRTHHLPQNMTNEEAFDAAINFKLDLISSLADNIPHNEMHVFNITNDNHAGSFGYYVASAIQKIINAQYEGKVKVYNQLDFLDVYYYGRIAFVLTHGKDKDVLKQGMPAKLDDKTEKKLDAWLKHHNVYSKADLIIVEKGDTHQQILDHASSTNFLYHSYMALSPASSYVEGNYSKGRNGYNLMIVNKETMDIDICPRYFN